MRPSPRHSPSSGAAGADGLLSGKLFAGMAEPLQLLEKQYGLISGYSGSYYSRFHWHVNFPLGIKVVIIRRSGCDTSGSLASKWGITVRLLTEITSLSHG